MIKRCRGMWNATALSNHAGIGPSGSPVSRARIGADAAGSRRLSQTAVRAAARPAPQLQPCTAASVAIQKHTHLAPSLYAPVPPGAARTNSVVAYSWTGLKPLG